MSLIGVIAASCNRTGPVYVPPVQAATLRSLLYDSNGGKQGDVFLPTTFQNGIYQEPTAIDDMATAGHIKLYVSSAISDTESYIALFTATSKYGPYTAQGICVGNGNGGAPVGRQAYGSYVFKKDGTYYMYCTNGYGFPVPEQDRNIYLYTSPTGMPGTWVDGGLMFQKDTGNNIYGFGNSCVHPEPIDGTYYAFQEVAPQNGVWNIQLYTATALTGPWTRQTGPLETLRPVADKTFGGAFVRRHNNLWHMWHHYGSGDRNDLGGNLPTYLAYATSGDGISWTKKETGFLKIEAEPFGPAVSIEQGTTQIADVSLAELAGEVILFAVYVENTSPVHSQVRMWRTGKTWQQLIDAMYPPAT